MSQTKYKTTTTTTIIIILLLTLCLQINAFTFSLRKNLLMNAHATSSGIVDLKKDSLNGFYVEADFSSSSTASNDPSDTVKMMISLANEDTLVTTTNCLDFSSYDCSKYNCNSQTALAQWDYPTFTASISKMIQSYIHLDYNYWNKDSPRQFYTATSCQTGDTSSNIGRGRYGVLGLGVGIYRSDFTSSAIFSIFINSDLSQGKLLFMKDTSYAQSFSPLSTFYTNSTWQIANYRGYLQTAGYSVRLKSCNIMFDVNSDAIGIPYDYYPLFMAYFGFNPSVWCNSDLYRPTCYTTQKLEDLPDIILTVDRDELTIPSAIYATFASTSGNYTYFYFNFKATGSNMTGKSYVSPSFKDSIILDAHFLSYYYAVFDATGNTNTISLYLSINAPENYSYAKWIIIGVVGVFLLVGIGFYVKKKKAAALISTKTPAPLVDNQQGMNNHVYSINNQGGMYVPPAQAQQ